MARLGSKRPSYRRRANAGVILTDREIQIALSRKQIIIEPLPQQDTAYSSTSVDLTLDPILTLFDTGKDFVKKVIDPTHPEYDIDEALKEITKEEKIDPKKGYDLEPKQFVIGLDG
jgi:dCTP deaminase